MPPFASAHGSPEVLVDSRISDQIASIRHLIREINCSEEKRAEYRQWLESIEARARSPRLRLAFVGEFASGKSTFINALLRRRLLKASCLTTTASATYITNGGELAVQVRFLDGTCHRATEAEYGALAAHLLTLVPEARCSTFEDVLALVTAHEDVANRIARVDLQAPVEHWTRDLIVIDTPGIGAAATGTSAHAEVTRQVIEETADTVVVLIPAQSAMTKTLSEFLRVHLAPFLHRCLFIITGVDRLHEQERREVRAFVAHRLANDLGLDQPEILESAAVAMLPGFQSAEREIWHGRFLGVESCLMTAMLRQRSVVISESLVRLLRRILAALDAETHEIQDRLAKDTEILRRNSVATLQSVLAPIHAAFLEGMRRATEHAHGIARMEAGRFEAAAKESALVLLRASNRGTLPAVLKSSVPDAISRLAEAYRQQAIAALAPLALTAESAHASLLAEFARHYSELTVITSGNHGGAPDPKAVTRISPDLRAARALAPGSTVHPAFAAGLLFFGLPGWLALAGIAFTRWLLYDHDATCARIREKLWPAIEGCVAQSRDAVLAAIDAEATRIRAQFESTLGENHKKYASFITYLVSEHDAKTRTLQSRVARVRNHRDEISERAARLESEQLRLQNATLATP